MSSMDDTTTMFKTFRVKHRMTQAQLAAMIGLSSNQVARVERGESKTSRSILLLLEYLDKELSEARNAGDD